MPQLKPGFKRTKLIVLRLTPAEYGSVERASRKFRSLSDFVRHAILGPVPKGGETRIRIFKTYTDPASYTLNDGKLVFIRPLGIKRNVVLLPKGWELIECASPAIVSSDADGRIRVSFLNDRDDQLPVKIVARRLP